MKTILLVHGWNNILYTKHGCANPWYNRQKFIDELSKKYNLEFITFPGFCGEDEPNTPWNLNQFAKYFQEKVGQLKNTPNAVLGYSFGGAVAVRWAKLYKPKTKLILVSPAIIRAYKQSSLTKFGKFFPESVKSLFRGLYLNLIGNKFYSEGTPFLKKSYLSIVTKDLSSELLELNPNSYQIIFGSEDTATPPKLLLVKVSPDIANNISIIKGGTHDIANTHTNELMDLINSFVPVQ